ncbi:nascent polypeptide-associated complex subunit alpha, muscle-specific form-like isoform X3 [Archocentrus centrarchus]|uniref:nascent polypeptide-associated complex subunit alpha, muscle-specific form-like isoform X3 n=1 Tax=Archocentrus centrarchus TaxID=63155 RepID=UPI0011EA2006|nr:nascent polypeptide-associated complex subunit alpha, muscle-specific form-like isoform X3 [Archocentrus centrarchus]
MDLQICHCCGWSKVTTYQGLRIHQGRMGCTPKGVRVAEPQQKYSWGYVGHANTQIDLKLDVHTSYKIKETTEYSDLSLQVCHCGWSKRTTYQGLRIHQGRMGCTPKGAGIPKKEQYDWKNQREEMDHWKHLSAKKETVKKQNFPESPSMYSCANAGATAIFKEEYKLTASVHAQRSSLQELPTLPQVSRTTREPSAPPYPGNVVRPKKKKIKQQTLSQMEESSAVAEYWSVDCYTDYATPAVKIKEEPKSLIALAAPRSSFQRTSSRQLQEFSTAVPSSGFQAQQSVRAPPTAPPLEAAVLPMKKDRREQTQATGPARKPSAPPYPGNIHTQKEKKIKQPASQMEESSAVAEYWSADFYTDYATPAVKIKEEPKSPLAAPRSSFQRTSSCQPQEFPTAVTVQQSVGAPPTAPPLEAAVLPMKKNRSEQTQSSGFQVQQSVRAPPTAPPLEAAVLPMKKDRREQTQATGPARKTSAPPYPGNIHTQKEKKIKQPASQTEDSSAVAGYLRGDRSADCATTATKINKKPKSSLATPQPSFQRATSSQQQELSSGVQVKGSVREASSTLQLEAAVTPKETNREHKTQGTKSSRYHPPSPPPVPPKKNSALFKEMLESFKTELQPKIQMMEGKSCEIRPAETACRPESVPDLTNTNSQTGSAAADVSPKENPTLLNEAAEAEGSTGMKVKELARRFSATTASETVIPPKEKHGAHQKLSQNSAEPTKISSCADSTATPIIREEYKPSTSAFAQRPSQRANNSKSDHQLQTFCTLPQVTGPARKPSAPPYPGNIHTQKEKTMKQPTLSQMEDSSAVAGYWSVDIYTDDATPAVKVKEKPKSPLATPQPSFQRATSSQQQELSSGVQVKGSVREVPSTLQLEAAVTPKETNREHQTQMMSLASDHPTTTHPEAAEEAEEKHRENPTFPQGTKSSRYHPPSPPPVPPKKNSALFKEMLESFKTELQPKIQMMEGKSCEIRPAETACRPESVPDLTNTNSQTGSAAADVSPKENPTLLNEAAEAEGSTGMKVKELARRFSATTASETVIPPKEKHGAPQKLSQVKLLTQRFSAISAQETAGGAKEKQREEQKRSQMLTDSTRDATKVNSAATKATLEKGPELSCENAQFSSGLKVKDLARMFSASATQEKAIGPKEKQREEQKPAQRVKLLVWKLSAREGKDHHTEKDEEDQKPSKI